MRRLRPSLPLLALPLLLLLPALVGSGSVLAHDLCTPEGCREVVDDELDPQGCPTWSWTSVGPLHFERGGQRDPAVGSYTASWTRVVTFVLTFSGCAVLTDTCTLTTPVGAWQSYRWNEVVGAHAAFGPTAGGGMDCGTTCPNLVTYVGGDRTTAPLRTICP